MASYHVSFWSLACGHAMSTGTFNRNDSAFCVIRVESGTEVRINAVPHIEMNTGEHRWRQIDIAVDVDVADGAELTIGWAALNWGSTLTDWGYAHPADIQGLAEFMVNQGLMQIRKGPDSPAFAPDPTTPRTLAGTGGVPLAGFRAGEATGQDGCIVSGRITLQSANLESLTNNEFRAFDINLVEQVFNTNAAADKSHYSSQIAVTRTA